jgi:hypothetical protein
VRDNPFYELYLSDSMPAKEFVTLFSDKLLPHAQLLFKPGNVVITGMMGSGKSMLLKLLQFETRLMYLTETKEFPIPAESRNFISCNINLAHSSAIDFGNRRWSNTEPSDVESMFADYFNVVLVLDLLSSVESYSQTEPPRDCRRLLILRRRSRYEQCNTEDTPQLCA